MADDILNAGAQSTGLNLGRVSVEGIRRPRQQAYQPQESTVVGALSNLANVVANGLVARERKAQFYEGQKRVLQASLEGTQREELTRIQKEQPWYATLLGPSAMSEGALDMASRVGAGKIFDQHVARLANNEDAEINPDTYRENIMGLIKGQETGDISVDEVFMPKLLAAGQKLVAAQLDKHMEFQARSTTTAVVTQVSDAINAFDRVRKAEISGPVSFRTADDDLPTATRTALSYLEDTIKPSNRPKNLEAEKWADLQLMPLIAHIEQGNTVLMRAVKSSGFEDALTSKQRDQLTDAFKKGKKVNDANHWLQMDDSLIQVENMIINATSMADLDPIKNAALEVRQKFLDADVEPPKEYASLDAINDMVRRTVGIVDRYNDKMVAAAQREQDRQDRKKAAALLRFQTQQDRRKEKLADVIEARDQTQQVQEQVWDGAKTGNPGRSIAVKDSFGGHSVVENSQTLRNETFAGIKAGWHAAEQAGTLPDFISQISGGSKAPIRNLADVAHLLQVKDDEKAGRIQAMLGPGATAKELDIGTLQALKDVTDLSALKDPRFLKQHIPDDDLRANAERYIERMRMLPSDGSPQSMQRNMAQAWRDSFGDRPLGKVSVTRENIAKAAKSSSDVKDLVKSTGIDGPAVQYGLVNEAYDIMRRSKASTPAEALKQAVNNLKGNIEVVATKTLTGVPAGMTVAERSGLSPEYADLALTSMLDKRWGAGRYHVVFDPVREQHFVQLRNEDGEELNMVDDIDYNEIRKVALDRSYKPSKRPAGVASVRFSTAAPQPKQPSVLSGR